MTIDMKHETHDGRMLHNLTSVSFECCRTQRLSAMLSSFSKDNGIFRFIILLVLHNILFGSRQIVSLAQSRSEYCDACHPVCGRRYFVRVAGATMSSTSPTDGSTVSTCASPVHYAGVLG